MQSLQFGMLIPVATVKREERHPSRQGTYWETSKDMGDVGGETLTLMNVHNLSDESIRGYEGVKKKLVDYLKSIDLFYQPTEKILAFRKWVYHSGQEKTGAYTDACLVTGNEAKIAQDMLDAYTREWRGETYQAIRQKRHEGIPLNDKDKAYEELSWRKYIELEGQIIDTLKASPTTEFADPIVIQYGHQGFDIHAI